jgi:twitching motility protein PilT
MAHVDKFIAVVFKYGADRLVLAAGRPALLVSGAVQRPVTGQALTGSQVEDLMQEILPLEIARGAQPEVARTFRYASPSGEVSVTWCQGPQGPQAELAPASAPAAAAGLAFGQSRVDVAVTADAAAGRFTAVAGVKPATAPAVPHRRARIDSLFETMLEHDCSDLHLSVGSPPLYRKDGEIASLGDPTPLAAEALREMLLEITPGPHCTEFEERHDTDFAYEFDTRARFRANLYMDRRGMGAVFRCIPNRILSPQEVGLGPAILDLCMLPKGLVLVSGPTGAGKTTTLATLVDYINSERAVHIVTIEDPIEYVHANKRSLVNQREVGRHTESFAAALRAALREDPDVILVGEMRDLETTQLALETAETGHLVLGTVHTTGAAAAVDRVVDQFPGDRQAQVRAALADCLRGVVSQNLVRRRGGGLVAALEVMLVTSAVSNLIRDGKTFQISSVLQTGRAAGMTTMNDALLELVQQGIVTADAALQRAPQRVEFRQLLERAGVRTLPREGSPVPA